MPWTYDPTNIFARMLRGEIPNKTVFENDHALAFHDIHPQANLHVLVIPKGPYVSIDHFAAEATPEEQAGFLSALAEVCRILDISDAGFRAIANTGDHGRQEVPHFHLHVVGGEKLGAMLPR